MIVPEEAAKTLFVRIVKGSGTMNFFVILGDRDRGMWTEGVE